MSTPNSAAAAPAGAAAEKPAAAAGAPAAAEGAKPGAAGAAAAAEAGKPGAAAAAGAEGAKPAGEVKPGEKPGDAAAAGPPEKYTLTLPDGGPLDAEDLPEFEAAARAAGLTNEQAQAALATRAGELTAQSERFLTATKAHAEIGGANLEAAQQRARAVLDKYLPADSAEGKELRSAMDKTGYGNWAPLVLVLSRIGKAMAEDKPVTPGSERAEKPRDAVSVLYGS
jgi:hypothetical protein